MDRVQQQCLGYDDVQWQLHYDPMHAVTQFMAADSLLFNDNSSVVPANTSIDINGAGNVAVGRLMFNNNSDNYTILSSSGKQIVDGGPFNSGNGTLNIVGSIVMNGAGQVTISTTNTFTGGVTLTTTARSTSIAPRQSGRELYDYFIEWRGDDRQYVAAGAITMTANNPQVWSGNFSTLHRRRRCE